jgi:hypothetical protein
MDWLRSEDLKEEKNVTAPVTIIAVEEPIALCRCQEHKAYQLGISRMHPECSDSGRSDRSVAADVLLRQEPDEEEDEEEGEGDGKEKQEDDNDDATDDGYSE